MRCAIHSCERAMAVMEDFARTEIPKGGVTEDDVWAVLHAENIKRGGEWIETRLLTPARALTHGSRNVGHGLFQRMKFLPSTLI